MLYIPRTEVVQISSCAGLVYTTCEWLHGLPFEVKNIWRNPDFPFHLRCIYILARYVGLVGQVEFIVSFNYLLKTTSTSRMICDVYWSIQQYTCVFIMTLILCLSFRRVYMLWDRNCKIGVLLFLLLTLHITSGLIFGPLAIRNITYTGNHCFAFEGFPNEVVYWSAVQIFIQVSIWALGFAKCISFGQVLVNGPALLLISWVKREGFVIAILASVIPISIVADGLWINFASGMTSLIAYLVFPTFLSIATSTICRTIQNMHQLSQKMLQESPSTRGVEEGIILTSAAFNANFSSIL